MVIFIFVRYSDMELNKYGKSGYLKNAHSLATLMLRWLIVSGLSEGALCCWNLRIYCHMFVTIR